MIANLQPIGFMRNFLNKPILSDLHSWHWHIPHVGLGLNGHVRFSYNPYFSACFFNRNSVFLSQQISGVGGTTPDTHDRLHGLRPQGWSSPQHEALRSTALLGVPRKTPGRYSEDTTRSIRIRSIP